MATQTLSITDNRTGASYQIPIEEGAIRASALRQIKVDEDDFGLMSYDPAFLDTASVRSATTFIDGGRGILRYRGYPTRAARGGEQLPGDGIPRLFGERPGRDALGRFADAVTHHTFLHENIK